MPLRDLKDKLETVTDEQWPSGLIKEITIMNKIQIKSRFNDSVLFEHDGENNSIKRTLEAAVKANANLRNADLLGANLRGANLRNADLRNADLLGANLRDANLRNADLLGANLRDAYLCDAYLRGAYLRGADLLGAIIADGFICDGDFHHIARVGSEGGTLELYSCGKAGWYVKRGCFGGNKQEFLNAVAKTHGDNEHGKKYRSIVELFCGDNNG